MFLSADPEAKIAFPDSIPANNSPTNRLMR
jgi:hypothetical protein